MAEYARAGVRRTATGGARGRAGPASRSALNQAPPARAVAQLQHALNQSPRVSQLTGLSAALQGTTHVPVQLMSARPDRERLRAAQHNRVRFLAILMVVAANIANGNYALEDVDDLVQGPDHGVLVDEVRRRQELRAERRAQEQQQRNQQRNERRGQRHQRGGYRHR